jgi:hypothetical protein
MVLCDFGALGVINPREGSPKVAKISLKWILTRLLHLPYRSGNFHISLFTFVELRVVFCGGSRCLPSMPHAQEALSRTTSVASLSSRRPRKTGCRKRSSRVHSENFTWQTICDSNQ